MNIKILKAALAGLVLSASGFANAGLISQDQFHQGAGVFTHINECCSYIAQSFTVGISGNLTAVSAHISYQDDLTLSIFNVNPAGTLGETALSGLTISGNGFIHLSDMFFLASVLSVKAGETYALVASVANDAQGVWRGSNTNSYAGGQIWGSPALPIWNVNYEQYDLNFATYVELEQVPEPSTLAIFAFCIMGLAASRFKKQ